MGCISGKKSRKQDSPEIYRIDQVSLVLNSQKYDESAQLNSKKFKQEPCNKKIDNNSNPQADLTSIKLHHRNSKDSILNNRCTQKDLGSEPAMQRGSIRNNADYKIDDIGQNLTISQNMGQRKSSSKIIKHSKEYNLSKLREIF